MDGSLRVIIQQINLLHATGLFLKQNCSSGIGRDHWPEIS